MKARNRRRPAAPAQRVSRRVAVPRHALRSLLRRLALVGAGLAAALVATVLAVPRAASWFLDHPYFAVESLEILPARRGTHTRLALGQPRLGADEIEAWVGLAPQTSIFRIDPGRLEARLEAHPWIRTASVRRLPPRRVVVAIEEHRPIAIVRLDDYYLVDRRGVVMGRVGPDDSHDLPIISGLDDGHGRTSLEVALPRVAHLLRRDRIAARLGPVSEIHFDAEHGATVFPMQARIAVALGWDGWRRRLGRARRVLDAWNGQTDRLLAIDLTRSDSVIVRVRDVPAPAAPGSGSARKTKV